MEDESLHSSAVLFLLGWAFVAHWLAWKMGYFSLPVHSPEKKPNILFRDVFGIFVLFMLTMLVLVPTGGLVVNYLQSGGWELSEKFEQGWVNVAGIIASTLVVLLFCFVIEPRTKRIIALPSWQKLRGDLAWGSVTWWLCFPMVSLFVQLVSLVLEFFGVTGEIDQVAVRYLKQIISEKPLFWASFYLIIFVVPFVEETLFRGFLQTWLRQHFKRTTSIIVSAAVFAGFHFSSSQGWQNFSLLTALFLLACYLGFLYEKRGSLWAPIGLHMTFNAISEIAIVAQEGGFL